ncbi:hypothetical protein T484DRAFT_1917336, partial [Baffinella frigidus]
GGRIRNAGGRNGDAGGRIGVAGGVARGAAGGVPGVCARDALPRPDVFSGHGTGREARDGRAHHERVAANGSTRQAGLVPSRDIPRHPPTNLPGTLGRVPANPPTTLPRHPPATLPRHPPATLPRRPANPLQPPLQLRRDARRRHLSKRVRRPSVVRGSRGDLPRGCRGCRGCRGALPHEFQRCRRDGRD